MLGREVPLSRCLDCGLVYAPEYADPEDLYVDGYDCGLPTGHPAFQEFMDLMAGRRLDIIERTQRPPATLLDVGCGSGDLLAVAHDRGWDVCGTEPVQEAADCARARAFDVRAGRIESADFGDRHFDVVSAFHVLEHMPNAVAFLRSLIRWVRVGGHIVVEVPNWRSVNRWSYGTEWAQLRPGEHVAHYSPSTLRATLRQAGLQHVRVHSPGVLWPRQSVDQMLDTLAGPQWRRWDGLARLLEEKNSKRESASNQPGWMSWKLLRVMEELYGYLRVGFAVLAIAKVPENSHE